MPSQSIANFVRSNSLLGSVIDEHLTARQRLILNAASCNLIMMAALEYHCDTRGYEFDLLFKISSSKLPNLLRIFAADTLTAAQQYSIGAIKESYRELLYKIPSNIPINHLWLEADSVMGESLSIFVSSNAELKHLHNADVVKSFMETAMRYSMRGNDVNNLALHAEKLLQTMLRHEFFLCEIGLMNRQERGHLKLIFSPSPENFERMRVNRSSNEYLISICSALEKLDLPIRPMCLQEVSGMLNRYPVEHIKYSISIYNDSLDVQVEIYPDMLTNAAIKSGVAASIQQFWQLVRQDTESPVLKKLEDLDWIKNAALQLGSNQDIYLMPHHIKMPLSEKTKGTGIKLYQRLCMPKT